MQIGSLAPLCVRFVVLAALGLLVGERFTSAQDSLTADAFELYFKGYISESESRDLPLPHFMDECDRYPQIAAKLASAYVESESRRQREIALLVLVRCDLQGSCSYIVEALREPHWVALRAVETIDWSRQSQALRRHAQELLTDCVRRGEYAAIEALASVGQAEARGVLRESLDRQLASSAQGAGEAHAARLLELRLREAMCKLGDPSQIVYFREQLNSPDRGKRRDALRRAARIASPELASGITSHLDEMEAGPDRCDGASDAQLAVQALVSTFPEAGGNAHSADRFAFWNKWTESHLPVPPEHATESLVPPVGDTALAPVQARQEGASQTAESVPSKVGRRGSTAFQWPIWGAVLAVGVVGVCIIVLAITRLRHRV